MPSALEEFRAQKKVVDQIDAQVKETTERLSSIQAQINAFANDPFLRELLRDEWVWLDGMRRALAEVRAFREYEMTRFWPGVWRRWAVAGAFALAAVAVGGWGYAWFSRPHEAELASLRLRVEMLDSIAQRVLKMTPAERRQFDGLVKPAASPNR